MKRFTKVYFSILVFLFVSVTGLFSASAEPKPAVVVGLYSENSDGYVSYRVGKGDWTVVAVGMTIPAGAEIKITIFNDWVELIQSGNPNQVYELTGSDTEVVKKLTDIYKTKPRTVSFPKGGKEDPAFKNKLTVKQYLGRQIYIAPNKTESDIKYGTLLDSKGKVTIIAINNTLNLVYPNGVSTNVIGPLKFDIENLFTGKSIYKLLNVAK